MYFRRSVGAHPYDLSWASIQSTGAIAVGTLTPVSELRQPLDRRLVLVERQTIDE
jgi:hypothetical protein